MPLGGDGARTKAGATGAQRRDQSKPNSLDLGNEGDEVTSCGFWGSFRRTLQQQLGGTLD